MSKKTPHSYCHTVGPQKKKYNKQLLLRESVYIIIFNPSPPYSFSMSRQEMTTDKDNEMRVTTKEQRSNMFAAFEPAQIREFKLFFNIIDQNHDGLIDKSDLHGVFVSLGKCNMFIIDGDTDVKYNIFFYRRQRPDRRLFGGHDERCNQPD